MAVVTGALWCAADALPATATWTGGGDRTVPSDPQNWACKDAGGNDLPGEIPDASTTVVTVTGETSFNCPAGATPIWKLLTISGTVNLTADCDWRGAGRITDFVAANTTINLRGHELFAKMPNNGDASLTKKITVTDNSAQGAGGRFHIDVAEGESFDNTTAWNGENMFWFTGTMGLVKEGKGTYCPNFPHGTEGFRYYTYTGGTTIHEGLLEMTNDPEGTRNEYYYAQNKRPVFGDYRTFTPFIRIDAGATIDYKGVYDISNYQTYMNGGTIKNTRKPAQCEYKAFGDLTFEADSFFDIARTAQQGGYFHLNGHTLTVNIAAEQDWYCNDGSGANGTIIITGEGVFHSYNSAIVAPTVNFDIATAISMDQPMTVSNYVARYEGTKNTGSQTMTVLGTFKPVTQNFYPCTLKGESCSRGGFPRIDLSEQTGAWNAEGAFGEVKFAPQTVVTIDVGDRTLTDGERVVVWSGAPQRAAFRIVGSQITTCEEPVADAEGLAYRLLPDSVVTRAEWTGAGARNDFADAANWRCWNCRGEIVPNVAPGAEANVYFLTSVNFDLPDEASRAKLDGYAAIHFASPLALGTDCDWRGVTPNDPLFNDFKTLDLNGHDFKLSGMDGVTAIDFTLTDTSAEGGTLVLDVAERTAFENTKVQLDGSLRLQKTGEGLYMPHRYNQNYTGGNEIAAGTVRLYNDTTANSSTYAPTREGPNPMGKNPGDGAARTFVRVQAGATLDINGVYDTGSYFKPTYLNGGTLTTSKNMGEYTWGGIGDITLEADSFLTLADASIVFYNFGPIDLGGYTLTATLGAEGAEPHFYVRSNAITNGTLVVTGSGVLDTTADTVDMSTTTLDLGTRFCLNGATVVSNYVARYAGAYVDGAKTISVIGSLKTVADRCHNTVMMEGSAFDLSARTTPQPLVTPIGTVTFDANATDITVDVGDRALQSGDMLIAWDARPADQIVFSLKGKNVEPGSELLSVLDSGLYYDLNDVTRVVTSATWTGAANDGNLANPANWAGCMNVFGNPVEGGVPGASATVTFNGDLNVGVGAGATLPWLKVRIGTVRLTADCDWRAIPKFFDAVKADSTIDLNGHRLSVAVVGDMPAVACTITDTTTDAEHPGELHIDVATGVSFTNDKVALSGNLRLVKEGAGTFVPANYNLNYTGGNEIAAGQITLNNPAKVNVSTYAMGQTLGKRPLGAEGKTLVVRAGAVYDINGVYDSNLIPVELAGGTLKNSKETSKTDWGAVNNVTVTAEGAVFHFAQGTVFNGSNIDLGGYMVTVRIDSGKTFYMNGGMTNGTLNVVSGGWIRPVGSFSAPTVSLVNNAAINMSAAATVKDYTSKWEGKGQNQGSATFSVLGTFTPKTDYFYGCTLQNGSTLDLSARTGAWSTQASFTGSGEATGKRVVDFAPGAKVKVDIGNRLFTDADKDETGWIKLVSWTTPPTDVKFVVRAAVDGYRTASREDGLYIKKSALLVIIF